MPSVPTRSQVRAPRAGSSDNVNASAAPERNAVGAAAASTTAPDGPRSPISSKKTWRTSTCRNRVYGEHMHLEVVILLKHLPCARVMFAL